METTKHKVSGPPKVIKTAVGPTWEARATLRLARPRVPGSGAPDPLKTKLRLARPAGLGSGALDPPAASFRLARLRAQGVGLTRALQTSIRLERGSRGSPC